VCLSIRTRQNAWRVNDGQGCDRVRRRSPGCRCAALETQINELAKAQAAFEFLPEADHNTLAGTCNPEKVLEQTFKIFLQSNLDHPRNVLRSQLTRESFMQQGINTDFYMAKGESKIQQMWSAVQFGDYTAYYLALAYDTDPTAIAPISALKEKMSH